ncbi:MAG TPA: DUF2721 domain-containing protein [Fimbriimonadaceae bacterium]|nr:DUF2721 domain-containing protein [Fimbriimonadaceae bacterium]
MSRYWWGVSAWQPIDMDTSSLASSPFAALTFIVAPALLTNSSSLLANSATMRLLRTREIMRDLFTRSRSPNLAPEEANLIVEEVERIEVQAAHLLKALYAVYVALGSFASATFVTLIAATIDLAFSGHASAAFAGIGVVLGIIGVAGLVFGSLSLIRATRMSLTNIAAEAASVRRIHSRQSGS